MEVLNIGRNRGRVMTWRSGEKRHFPPPGRIGIAVERLLSTARSAMVASSRSASAVAYAERESGHGCEVSRGAPLPKAGGRDRDRLDGATAPDRSEAVAGNVAGRCRTMSGKAGSAPTWGLERFDTPDEHVLEAPVEPGTAARRRCGALGTRSYQWMTACRHRCHSIVLVTKPSRLRSWPLKPPARIGSGREAHVQT